MKESNAQKKLGLPPGSLIYLGSKKDEEAKIDLIQFNQNEYNLFGSIKPGELKDKIKSDSINWFKVTGIHKTELIEKIGQEFCIDNLVLEDIVNINQRPKCEYLDDYYFVVLKYFDINKNLELKSEQVSFIMGENFVISFEESENSLFTGHINRIKQGKGKIRVKPVDYLFYRLIDIVVDHYYLLFEKINEQIETLDEEVYDHPDDVFLHKLIDLKKHLLKIINSVKPLKEAVTIMITEEEDLIEDDTVKYLQDLKDHIFQTSENFEFQRNLLKDLTDTYVMQQNDKMNNIMKLLTIIATIFIPLTFIAGIYGMNFEYMPELKWEHGYFTVWGIMTVIFIGMIFYFRKKKWF